MQLGIFARTFPRTNFEQSLDAALAHGFEGVQFNMALAGIPTLPNEPISDDLVRRIRDALEDRGLAMFAVSGTFNIIHPDPAVREAGFVGLEHLASRARGMGTTLITLCTGTLDPDDMWRAHPDNGTEAAWSLMRSGIDRAVEIAARHDVWLGIEPERANVVDSAARAKRLLDQVGSERIGIVLDPANLLHATTLPRMREIIREAADLIGDRLILAHAKEIGRDGRLGEMGLGKGVLDLDAYFRALESVEYDGPMILHGCPESEVAASLGFVLEHLLDGDDDFEDDDA